MMPFYQCDYLDQHTLPLALLDKKAELVHINGQISSLESHISQLTTLRNTLFHRSSQLHNTLSLIHNLPIEILSHIFSLLVDSGCDNRWSFVRYQEYARQAFVLASVSTHFRYIAFGTPELWRSVSLQIPNIEAIGKASSKLQHYIALASSVNVDISASEALDEEAARSAFDALLTPDTTQKIKSFRLKFDSPNPSTHWLDRLKAFGSPMLDTLQLWLFDLSEPSLLDIQMLNTITRFSVYTNWENVSIIVPPYVQYLDIEDVPEEMLVSLLPQCPNLIECVASFDNESFDIPDVHFPHPLSLPHLKHLSFGQITLLRSRTFVENLRLPSLEYLALGWFPSEALLLAENVSATLTTLVIHLGNDSSDSSFYNGLFQLGWITFHKLEEIYFECPDIEGDAFTRLIQTLELVENEDDESEYHHFPALRSIIVHFCGEMEPRAFLDMFKTSILGEAFHYDIRACPLWDTNEQWSPELLRELRSVVGSRRIGVTWAEDKIHELAR